MEAMAMSEDQTELEDAGAPKAKHATDPGTRGEWERAAALDDQSEHLRGVLDEAREAARRAHEADSLASGGEGVEPQDVQEKGSGDASADADADGAKDADGAVHEDARTAT
jgi:hypothetical protein